MKPFLFGKEIVKSFGTGEEKHRVLNKVSVDIKNGEFVSIMGPSGSGKSTLLYALSGMDGIDSGEVAFEGRNRHRDIKQLVQKARLLMEQMGIADLEQRDITQVSGGQLQRAGICRALMGDPNIAARTERVLFLCDGEIVEEFKFLKYTEGDFDKRVSEITKTMQSIGI